MIWFIVITAIRRDILTRADLTRADLTRADLSEADLSGADLREAANLSVDQLCTARTLYRTLLDTDLKVEVKRIRPDLFILSDRSQGSRINTKAWLKLQLAETVTATDVAEILSAVNTLYGAIADVEVEDFQIKVRVPDEVYSLLEGDL